MSDTWTTVAAAEVRVGDTVRRGGQEFVVARVDAPFLGRSDMVSLIEDTPARWHAHPARVGDALEVRRQTS